MNGVNLHRKSHGPKEPRAKSPASFWSPSLPEDCSACLVGLTHPGNLCGPSSEARRLPWASPTCLGTGLSKLTGTSGHGTGQREISPKFLPLPEQTYAHPAALFLPP